MSRRDYEDDPEAYWADREYWSRAHGEEMLRREEREHPERVPFTTPREIDYFPRHELRMSRSYEGAANQEKGNQDHAR